MEIHAESIGKRYNFDWIFRNLSIKLVQGKSYVILGGNGSGKSTLLKCLMGFTRISEGGIIVKINQGSLPPQKTYSSFSFCSPYQDLYEELKLHELVRFHNSLKPFLKEGSADEFIERIGLEEHRSKTVKFFSSGMKQRLRLGLAILSDAPGLFLDEPTSNLDPKGIAWYRETLASEIKDKLVLIASNHQKSEYDFCDEKIEIEEFKSSTMPR